MEKTNGNEQLQIEIKDEQASGTYANFAIITHSNSEFVLDFASYLPGMPKGKVQSRIIMVPENAKRLLFALQDNIRRYEEQFGPIEQKRSDSDVFVPNINDFKAEA